jgi:hypothetical protein
MEVGKMDRILVLRLAMSTLNGGIMVGVIIAQETNLIVSVVISWFLITTIN